MFFRNFSLVNYGKVHVIIKCLFKEAICVLSHHLPLLLASCSSGGEHLQGRTRKGATVERCFGTLSMYFAAVSYLFWQIVRLGKGWGAGALRS